MPQLAVNDVELFYEEKGSGEVLILIHGLTSNHHMLKQEMNYFHNHYRVIAYDARGHGKSSKPDAYSLADHIQDVIALMDTLEIEQASLLGMSMGTYIAQGVAIAIPDRVKKLILVSGSAHHKNQDEGLMAEHQRELGHLAFDEQLGRLVQYIFHDLDAVGTWMASIPGRLIPEQQQIAADALADFDFRNELNQVTAETLVISGKYDGLNPPAQGKEIADHIPHAHFYLFEQSGHAPNIEEPERFLALITDFLSNRLP
ncbi:alpha/beta fold hydrolase [Ornithinibacillus gellani]|uniref:alpha/beta fold hydrolase n=1 Tax=Ornithinibacillus gellani TaxID=2293253 RepID=UPI000F49867E|nr:alpha/beta hydrolase [Ornithinibacillus gellani]TQS75392.1 alpha/beta fold hydrolase [Ornithinibacillus gellani]